MALKTMPKRLYQFITNLFFLANVPTALKITTDQWSLTVATAFVTAE